MGGSTDGGGRSDGQTLRARWINLGWTMIPLAHAIKRQQEPAQNQAFSMPIHGVASRHKPQAKILERPVKVLELGQNVHSSALTPAPHVNVARRARLQMT